MKRRNLSFAGMMAAGMLSVLGFSSAWGNGPTDARALASKGAERQIRQILEPLLEGYCQMDAAGLPSCKILKVDVQVDRASAVPLAPGFEEAEAVRGADSLAPKSASMTLLVDSRIGPVSRRKLLDIVDQYLSVLSYPVMVESRTASFPQPAASAGKVAAAREKVVAEFREKTEQVLSEYCGNRCILGEVELDAEAVNPEELQYGSSTDLVQQDGVAIKIGGVKATVLMDESVNDDQRKSLEDILRLKSAAGHEIAINSRVIRFPSAIRAGDRAPAGKLFDQWDENGNPIDERSLKSESSLNSTSESRESSSKQESFNRVERIERVENGDAVQAELQKFKFYGIIFSALVLSLLGLIAALGFRQSGRTTQQLGPYAPLSGGPGSPATSLGSTAVGAAGADPEARARAISVRYEIERQKDDLSMVFAESPKVAKVVFSRILTEEGVETTAAYMQIFGESIVVDMLRDPSLQSDLNQLTEYYARNSVDLSDDEQLDLLRKLSHRTVAGKLTVMGSRASNLFDFLMEMDGLQIAELVRTESMTVKAIVVTQCDPMKRNVVFGQLDDQGRIELMAELSRIDYLPRDYIHNVANALKRKRRDNPKLNTEALPGSEVLVSLLEKTTPETQKSVMKSLAISHPESVRTIKSKLVSIDTLRFLREGQMLEILLAIKHDELLHFLGGASHEIRSHVFAKAPKDLVVELEDELENVHETGRDVYQAVERKILNRIKLLAQEGAINLVETNERMFAEQSHAAMPMDAQDHMTSTSIRRAS